MLFTRVYTKEILNQPSLVNYQGKIIYFISRLENCFGAFFLMLHARRMEF